MIGNQDFMGPSSCFGFRHESAGAGPTTNEFSSHEPPGVRPQDVDPELGGTWPEAARNRSLRKKEDGVDLEAVSPVNTTDITTQNMFSTNPLERGEDGFSIREHKLNGSGGAEWWRKINLASSQ